MNNTPRSSKILQKCEHLAAKNSQNPNEVYLFLALLTTPDGIGFEKLQESGVDVANLTRAADQAAAQLPEPIPMNQLLQHIASIASANGQDFIGSEHILMGLLDCPNIINLFESSEQPIERVREMFMTPAGVEDNEPHQAASDVKSGKTPALEVFGRNLTAEAAAGKLDPVIGRQDQITRMMQILCRRTKNNPVLIGEAGVGKTAVVEGLAQAIAHGEVPDILAGKKIFMLDLAKMVAGTKYRGQFEERLKVVMKECEKDKQIILFLDELHTIVGAGSASGSMDASNMLKPALSRGELQCIGATTEQEYRKFIEKDAALERRFQTVHVPPTTVTETSAILRGLRSKFEEHHKLQIPDAALDQAARLADRYIQQRHLPDKAIDVLDESCSRVRMRVQREFSDREKAVASLQEQKNSAVLAKNFTLAAELGKKQSEFQVEPPAPSLTEADIHATISKMTGIPSGNLSENELAKVLGLERWLGQRMIGQEQAVSAVARTVRRGKADLQDPNRPLGSFLLLGPTGTGKTYLTKLLSEHMFGSPDSVVQIDMSEYMEKHAVSRLIGAAPGYIGYDEGGQLTEAVRKNPHSIVLFDEVEKAHPDALNLLLQILEEGKLTDSSGRKVDFCNCLIFLTSNVGASHMRQQRSMGFSHSDARQNTSDMAQEEAKRTFRPELLNRLSEIIVFNPLDRPAIGIISDLEIAKVANRLKDKNIQLVLDEQAQAFLVDSAYSEEYGARHVRRVIESSLQECLVEPLLTRAKFTESEIWKVTLKEGKTLQVHPQPKLQPPPVHEPHC